MATHDETASDSIRVTSQPIGVRGAAGVASDAIVSGDSLEAHSGAVLREIIRITQTQVPNHNFRLTASDQTRLVEALGAGWAATLTDDVAVMLTQQDQLAVQVVDALELAPAVASVALYSRAVADRVMVAEAISRFFGADIVELINVAPLMAGVTGQGAQATDTIGIADAIAPRLVLRVVAEDDLYITAADALQMIYSPALADEVEISAAYISPGSSITTWAMNTRTAAVSEYRNYAFNSFAQLGNKYLGAGDDGLYELTGDDDAGTDIISTIRSGFAQWSGTHLGSFKAAYLAVRGEGSFVLRVITPDDRTVNYTVTAENMKTVKVNMGKGLRARYFAFELVSTGQDFDLDTLEFIPLVADRRV